MMSQWCQRLIQQRLLNGNISRQIHFFLGVFFFLNHRGMTWVKEELRLLTHSAFHMVLDISCLEKMQRAQQSAPSGLVK